MSEEAIGRLAGAVALVVGGGQTPGETIGNGRATCVRFAQEGAYVVVADRILERAEDAVAELVTGDRDLGRLDVLVNNVGIGGGDGGPVSLDEEVWDRTHRVNLKDMYLTCKHLAPRHVGAGAAGRSSRSRRWRRWRRPTCSPTRRRRPA